MIVIVGASATGKTEVAKILSNKYNLKKVVTHTTRNRRVNEVDGIDYHFVTKEQFIKLNSQHYFLENTIYNDNYYGTSYDEVADNKCLIVDANGLNFYRKLKNTVLFKLVAQENTRYNRMIKRGDSLASIEQRLKSDKIKFSEPFIGKVDYELATDIETAEQIADKIYSLYCHKIKK